MFFGNKSGVNLKQIFRSLAREGKSEINCSLVDSRILYTVEKKNNKEGGRLEGICIFAVGII